MWPQRGHILFAFAASKAVFSDFTSTHAQVFSCSLCFLADGKHVQRQRNLLLRRLLYLRAGRGATATANKWRVTHFLSYPGLSLMDGWYCCDKKYFAYIVFIDFCGFCHSRENKTYMVQNNTTLKMYCKLNTTIVPACLPRSILDKLKPIHSGALLIYETGSKAVQVMIQPGKYVTTS